MEAAEILKILENAFPDRCFIIDIIVSYNEITMWDFIKHLSIFYLGKVLKSPKGKLDEEIPVPSFLTDPSHPIKVFSKHIFSIIKDGQDQRYGCTKADTLRINKDWGCMIKKNRNNSLD